MAGCCEILGRIIIGIINVLLMLIGLVFLFFGVVVKIGSDVLQNLFKPVLDMVKAQAKSATNQDISVDNFNINDLVGGLSTAFIIIGVFLFVICLIGLCGACCLFKILLIIYDIFIGMVTLAALVFVIIAAVNSSIMTEPGRAPLKTTLQQEYQGINGTDVTSLMWNAIMNGLECCGIDNYNDFATATKWKAAFPSFQSPAACCKKDTFSSSSQTCATTPSDSDSNYKTGCYNKVWDFIFKGTVFIVTAIVVVLFPLLVFAFSAYLTYVAYQKSKVGV